jgi:tRNA (guanosine-2'-O-)-methyltransferase
MSDDLESPIPPHPLDALLTPERARKYRQVLARRTGRIAVIIEDCYDPHNATAIIRTCDAMGIHEVHVTTTRNAFKINRKISQGSHLYVDMHVHADIAAAYAELRARGFRIFVSDLAAGATVGPHQLTTLLAQGPIALVFGSEGEGVTKTASDAADGHFLIPMSGFPQSLNVSVSVAVTLYALRHEALEKNLPGDLPAAQQISLYEQWVREHKGPAAEIMMRTLGRNGEDLDVFRAKA